MIRKTFYDLWDNMFKLGVLNLIFLVSLSIPLLLPAVLPDIAVLKTGVRLIGILWCSIYLALIAFGVRNISDYDSLHFSDLLKNFRAALPVGIVAAVLFSITFALLFFIVPFYLMLNNFAGLMFASLSFWCFLSIPPMFQFLFAARIRLKGKLFTIIKKCLIIFFDNPFFCIASIFLSILAAVLSTLMAFLFPGPAGLMLLLDEALRLRLLKYDWLEAHPDIENPRKVKIPWDEILIDERELTGKRSLRSLIFPWKD